MFVHLGPGDLVVKCRAILSHVDLRRSPLTLTLTPIAGRRAHNQWQRGSSSATLPRREKGNGADEDDTDTEEAQADDQWRFVPRFTAGSGVNIERTRWHRRRKGRRHVSRRERVRRHVCRRERRHARRHAGREVKTHREDNIRDQNTHLAVASPSTINSTLDAFESNDDRALKLGL